METNQLLNFRQLILYGFQMLFLIWHFIENICIKQNNSRRYLSTAFIIALSAALFVSYLIDLVFFTRVWALIYSLFWGGLTVTWIIIFKRLKKVIANEKKIMELKNEFEEFIKEWKS